MGKLMFSKTHEWILVDGNTARLGISDHAQKQMGDLVFIELPEVGSKVECGKPFTNVESVKAVSEAYSPACGTVTAVNTKLELAPETVNNAPLETWIVEIEVSKICDGLMNEEEYKAFIG